MEAKIRYAGTETANATPQLGAAINVAKKTLPSGVSAIPGLRAYSTPPVGLQLAHRMANCAGRQQNLGGSTEGAYPSGALRRRRAESGMCGA